MNIFRILNGVISAAQSVFQLIHNKPAKPIELLPDIVTNLFKVIDAFSAKGELQTKEQIDYWFSQLDTYTGDDSTAKDLLGKDISPQDEEFIFDHLLEAGRRYAYRKAGIV